MGKIPNNPLGRKYRSNTKQSKIVAGEGVWIWKGKLMDISFTFYYYCTTSQVWIQGGVLDRKVVKIDKMASSHFLLSLFSSIF